jgi:transposase
MPPRYTDEFKQEAVKQVINNNYPIKDTADRLGVHPDSLKTWVSRYKDPQSTVEYTQLKTMHDEMKKLKSELKRVTEERDILKKAAAYFARNQG